VGTVKLLKPITVASALSVAVAAFAADKPVVRVEPPSLQGPRQLQQQTAKAAVQDYLESWAVLGNAFSQNRPELLDKGFIGDAEDKLAATIKQQQSGGVHTVYRDKSHDVKILFYSPDGLSIELADAVQYDVQLYDHDKAIGTEQVHAQYIVVLTPTEVRWRVRIFQAQPE
jgi:hypothetical protein